MYFIGDCKNSSKGQKGVQFEAAFSVQSAPQEYGGHVELGFGQPTMIYGKYPHGDQYYGMLSAYGPQITDSYQLALELDKAWKQSTDSGAPVDVVSSLRRYEDARRLQVAVIHGLARMAAIMASSYKAYLGVGLGPLSTECYALSGSMAKSGRFKKGKFHKKRGTEFHDPITKRTRQENQDDHHHHHQTNKRNNNQNERLTRLC